MYASLWYRALEERERVERQREEEELQRQKRINDELAQARLQQHHEKMLKLVETAIAEKREFERVAASQREMALAEQARREAEKTKRLEHMKELRKQIEQRSAELENLKQKQRAEAEALRQAEEENRRCIERARVSTFGITSQSFPEAQVITLGLRYSQYAPPCSEAQQNAATLYFPTLPQLEVL